MAAGAAFFLLVAACAPPKTVATITSPTPSASPTPTAPLAAAGPTYHVGEVGVPYSPVALTATGGVVPYKYTVVAGALPDGLSLGVDGSISGTPTVGGSFAFTIEVADSGDSTTKVDGKIAIADRIAAHLRPECSSYCNVELGCVTACGNFGSLTGGVGPYTFSTVGGTVPAGTSVVGFSLTGTFSGQTGWVQFTVQATDSLGASTTISPKFWMYPHISLSGGPIPTSPNSICFWPGYDPVNSPGCRAQFPYSGGTPNSGTVSASASWVSYTWNGGAVCASSPPVPTIAVGSGEITVTIPRAVGCGTNGYKGTLAITLTNQDLCSPATAPCSTSANVVITQASG